MGISTNAIFFYGIIEPEEGQFQYCMELHEAKLDQKYGKLFEKLHDNGIEMDDDEAILFKYGIHRSGYVTDESYKRACAELLDNVKCRIHIHCSYSSPMYFVAIEESVATAIRGYPITFGSKDCFKIDPTWNKKIREFCEKMGIHYKEPKWHMVSLWGQ